MDAPWYAVQSEPGSERFAADQLREAGFQSFLPLERVIRVANGKRRSALRPFFPGYLFATWEAGEDWTPICRTRGVRQVIRRGWGRPAAMPPGEVDGWLRRADIEGVIHDSEAARLEAEAASADDKAGRIVGRQVRIAAGPLTGFLATCVNADPGARRVELLLDLMGRQTTVPMALDDVEAADG